MTSTCELANTEEVTAAYYPGLLVIRASGTVPESCWRVTISKSLLTVWPPEFAIEQCRTSEVCLPAIRPYSIERSFPIQSIPEHVVIHDGQGPPREIEVDVQPDAAAAAGPQVRGEFVGYSDALSYDAALRDAVEQVPVSSNPDQGYFRFTVTEVAGEVGGIAGLRRLAVRIETDD